MLEHVTSVLYRGKSVTKFLHYKNPSYYIRKERPYRPYSPLAYSIF